MRTISHIAALLRMLGVWLLMQTAALGVIQGTAHDLSALGTGRGNPCRYCHTPHGAIAGTPLWSHELSTAVYQIYQSSSLDAEPGQPTGASKLCLSCHDGTVALTAIVGSGMTGGTYISEDGASLGTDLSDDHPVSFVYSDSLSVEDVQIKPASSLPAQMRLDNAGELQCTTCHDPHDNQYGDFLVMSNSGSQMCMVCHNLSGWQLSVHRTQSVSVSAAADEYLQSSEYTTMAELGCLNCHRPHSAGGRQRLLHFERLEDNCLNCHNGSVAQSNLLTALSRFSRHDVRGYDGIHEPDESPMAAPRHVECEDCHNPHAVTEGVPEQAPFVLGTMRGVSGVTIAGSVTDEAQFQYEVCFKCHADNPDRVMSQISRQITQTNTRFEFSPTNPSFHPVVVPGVNQDVPSLLAPLTVQSVIYCTDCHSSDPSSGVRGPHGSSYAPILAYRYDTADFTQESTLAYELCYQCHSRNSILGDESFPEHREHLDDGIPCSACHDAHGISSAQGSVMSNSHLINFDLSIVRPSLETGRLEYQDLGMSQGRCYLECHGVDHSPKDY